MDGERGFLPGNVGGTHGYTDIPEAVLDRTHGDHRETLDWYGEPVNPLVFDETRARFGVENIVPQLGGRSSAKSAGAIAEAVAVLRRIAGNDEGRLPGKRIQAISRASRSSWSAAVRHPTSKPISRCCLIASSVA